MLTAIKALLAIIARLTQYAQQKQLLEAGYAQAVLGGVREAEDAIERARVARNSVNLDSDSVRDDPRNRDRPDA